MPGKRLAGIPSCALIKLPWLFTSALYTSASAILFAFALLFWNQIFTWVSVNSSSEANSALSAMLR